MNIPEYNGPGLYEIKDEINVSVYIGSSKKIKKRILEHISELKKGTHRCSALQDAYNAGHTFSVSVIKKIHCSFVKEIQRQEGEEIQRRINAGEHLYNSQPVLSRYMPRSSVVELMADLYCREKYGKPLYIVLGGGPAAIDMWWNILKYPEREAEIRKEYSEVISYENSRIYYERHGKDYDLEQ